VHFALVNVPCDTEQQQDEIISFLKGDRTNDLKALFAVEAAESRILLGTRDGGAELKTLIVGYFNGGRSGVNSFDIHGVKIAEDLRGHGLEREARGGAGRRGEARGGAGSSGEARDREATRGKARDRAAGGAGSRGERRARMVKLVRLIAVPEGLVCNVALRTGWT